MTIASTHEEKGNAFIELVLVLPILLILALAGLEFSYRFRFYQLSTELSRELASKVYRYCIAEAKINAGVAGFNPVQCVVDSTNEFGQEFNNVAPGMHYLASVYVDTGGGVIKQNVCKTNGGANCVTGPSYGTRFSTTVLNKKAAYMGLVQDYSAIVIGEVYVPYTPVFFSFDLFNHPEGTFVTRSIYGSTII